MPVPEGSAVRLGFYGLGLLFAHGPITAEYHPLPGASGVQSYSQRLFLTLSGMVNLLIPFFPPVSEERCLIHNMINGSVASLLLHPLPCFLFVFGVFSKTC